jgi:CRP-like cAMP-binding protein/thioredoxin reductase/Fe-S-cluster-containing hydrogenase component 2
MSDADFQVAIIGAGPGGIAAATNAAKHGLKHALFEKKRIGNTIADYQLGKHVMAEPGRLPLRANAEFEAGTREVVLERWETAVRKHKCTVVSEEVTGLKKEGELFTITTRARSYTAERVILSIGLQGSPRKLPAEGADAEHVAYTLSDPAAFKGKHITVVGAGDAGIENALALAERNSVIMINRAGEFARAKDGNIAAILAAGEAKKIRIYYNAAVKAVYADSILIDSDEGQATVPCDHIIARLGCEMPRRFLEGCGIAFPSADPVAVPVVDQHYQSNIPGLYIIGALIGYPLIKQAMNQGHEVVEYILGNNIEPADQVLIDDRLKHLPGVVNENLQRIRESLPLFEALSTPQFRELISESTIKQVKRGKVVFKRNDYTDTFFSVVQGSVVAISEGGEEFEIGAGQFFGELGLISGRRRSATVKVKEDALLMESPRKQILKLMSAVEDVQRKLDETFMLRTLQTRIFPDVDLALLREVVTRASLKRFSKGNKIFAENDPGDIFYVIRKGSVKISRKNSAGQDVTQTYIAAGNYFGEMALLSEEELPRSATATAAVVVELICIHKQDFRELLTSNAAVQARIAETARVRRLENLLREQNSKRGELMDFVMKEGVTDGDNILIIDSDLCIGCDNCESACAATHGGTSRLDRKGGKSYAAIQIPISCRHCENPLCMLDCPPDALARQPNGEVVIRDSCIGCGNCVGNCPYGVIQLAYNKPAFSLFDLFKTEKKAKGPAKAAKCDQCEKLSGGPACVRACPTGAAIRTNPAGLMRIIGNER